MITEGDEESGDDVDEYILNLKDKIGQDVDIILCLDSGTYDYERLWLTKCLRGYLGGVLKIKTLRDGVHSGDSSGIVPSCFKIANIILNRLEDPETGNVHKRFHVDIPAQRYEEAYNTSALMGLKKFQ